MSTSCKTAMLSLQQQSMLKFCRYNEFFVLLRNVSGCSDKKVSLANYNSFLLKLPTLNNLCIVRELKSCQQLGGLLCCHYTNDDWSLLFNSMKKVCNVRDSF